MSLSFKNQDISIFTKLLFVGYKRDYDYDFWNIEKYSQVENIFFKGLHINFVYGFKSYPLLGWESVSILSLLNIF